MFFVILSAYYNKKTFTLRDYFSGDYEMYSLNDDGGECVNLGFCYINSESRLKGVIGERMVIKNMELEAALKSLKARVVKTEYLEDGTNVVYAHTNLINDAVEIFSDWVNLQIAFKNNRYVVGWPLILGSF